MAEPPVRLVKTIGDAAMLVSTEAEAMVEAALRLVEAAEEEGEEFPRLRAGIARGSMRCPDGRLLRPPGQPGQPHHRHRQARQRPGRRRGEGGGGRRLRLLLRRRAPPQGLRLPHQALPRPPRRAQIAPSPRSTTQGANCASLKPCSPHGEAKLHQTRGELWELVARQHGVVTRSQLLGPRLDRRTRSSTASRAGRLHPLWRGVYAVGRPEVSQYGRWMAAVLELRAAGACSATAAPRALWGIAQPETDGSMSSFRAA